VQQLVGGRWSSEVLFGDRASEVIHFEHSAPTAIAVTAINRYGLQSAPAVYLTNMLSERNH
jgi:hypothetical protein